MKAVSPPRSARKAASCVTEAARSCSDPLGLHRDMNDCYSRLKALVPSLPRDRRVSKMEILQHVIDYILDLQLALEEQSPVGACPLQRDVGSDDLDAAAR